jgi:hypothetical protein
MLSCGWPIPISRSNDRIAMYIALELPPTLEASVLLVGAILYKEFGCRAAILHPPHITLHPPFFPLVKLDIVVERVRLLASRLPKGQICYRGVESFEDAAGTPNQIIMAFEPSWCQMAHFCLVEDLSGCWDPTDALTMKLWPPHHTLHGYTPHVSLVIGDLPPDATQRKALKKRATHLMSELMRITSATTVFEPAQLCLIAYQHNWDYAPFEVVAGPAVITTVPIGAVSLP